MKAVKLKQNIMITTLRVMIISFFFLGWELGARSGVLDTFFFSSPTEIGVDLFDLFSSGKIYPHVLMTMREVFAGLFLGSLSGIFAGIVLGKYETIARVMDPVIMGLYAIPKMCRTMYWY